MLSLFRKYLTPLFISIIGIIIIFWGGIIYYVTSANTASSNVDVKKAPEVSEPTSPDVFLDALLRTWMITDACYDTASKRFFVKMYPHEAEDILEEGWYSLVSYKFVMLSNGTAVLESSQSSTRLHPDTTGLTCKQQAVDPDWPK